MIDTTIRPIGVKMIKTDMTDYPRFEMPEGFYITGYKEGYEIGWAEIAREQFFYESLEKGLEVFRDNFMNEPEWERLKDSVLFAVEEATGEIAAILSLWEGGIFSTGVYRRIHWVATREKFRGKGIIKAMMTYAMDLYHKQNGEGMCILATGTQSWQAIRIYKKFGFEAWRNLPHQPKGADYDPVEDEAWEIIDGKITEFDEKLAAMKKN